MTSPVRLVDPWAHPLYSYVVIRSEVICTSEYTRVTSIVCSQFVGSIVSIAIITVATVGVVDFADTDSGTIVSLDIFFSISDCRVVATVLLSPVGSVIWIWESRGVAYADRVQERDMSKRVRRRIGIIG